MHRRRFGSIRGTFAAAVTLAAAGCGAGTGGPVPTGAADGAAAPERVEPALAEAVFDSAWSLIHRTYYDTTFAGNDWLAVRRELASAARDAGTVDSLRTVIRGMMARLGDSHFAVIPADVADALDPDSLSGANGEPGDVGAELRVVDGEVVVFRVRPDGPAADAGVGPGWVVEAVDGREVAELLAAVGELETDRRLAEARLARGLETRLAGSVGDTVPARLRGPGDPVHLRLVPGPVPGTPVRFGNLPTMFAELRSEEIPVEGGCVGLIAFTVWMTPILPELERAFTELRHCDGFVLDLRGNPGGVAAMVMRISGYFMDEREPLGRLITRENELRMVAMPRRVSMDGEPSRPYDGPLALLVDGLSMSTSEIFAGGLQETGRARLFGVTTGGQALPALMGRLPNDDVLMHVFANLVTPGGARLDGRGVVPDVELPLERTKLLAGRDVHLEAALEWITAEAAATAASHNGEQNP
jgi:carboxyl-terminal processing protease